MARRAETYLRVEVTQSKLFLQLEFDLLNQFQSDKKPLVHQNGIFVPRRLKLQSSLTKSSENPRSLYEVSGLQRLKATSSYYESLINYLYSLVLFYSKNVRFRIIPLQIKQRPNLLIYPDHHRPFCFISSFHNAHLYPQ